MACISHPVNVPVPTFDEEERETEHNPPADNVYQYFQGTTCGCKGLFHKDKDNSFIVNKFNPSKLHNIISCISTYYKFADFY